jgi:hypothetical protein
MITRARSKDDERPVLPSNDEFRKAKGRSPNHFDAVKFACAWIEDGDKLGDPKKTESDRERDAETLPVAPQAKRAAPANDIARATQFEEQSRGASAFDRQTAVFERQWGRR